MVISKTKNTSKTVFISLNENQRKRILALLIKSMSMCVYRVRDTALSHAAGLMTKGHSY